MESSDPNKKCLISLMIKFGVVINILPFLGTYNKWKFIMIHLCSETKKTWDKYCSTGESNLAGHNKFESHSLKCFSKTMYYLNGELDNRLYEYLIKNKTLGRELRVAIKLQSKESYDLFLDLLQAIEDKDTFITFDRIECILGESQLAMLKWIVGSMDTLGISKNKIIQLNQLTPDEENTMVGQFGKPHKFISFIREKNTNRCEECRDIKVNKLENFNKLSTVKNVHTLIFSYNEIVNLCEMNPFNKSHSEMIPTHIKSTAKCIKINIWDGFEKWDVDISKISGFFPNVSQIKFRCDEAYWNILTPRLISKSHSKGGTKSNDKLHYTKRSFWFNLEFGQESSNKQSKITLFDCSLAIKDFANDYYYEVECERADICIDIEDISLQESYKNLIIIQKYIYLNIEHCRVSSLDKESELYKKLQTYNNCIVFKTNDIHKYSGFLRNIELFSNKITDLTKLTMMVDRKDLAAESFTTIVENIPGYIEITLELLMSTIYDDDIYKLKLLFSKNIVRISVKNDLCNINFDDNSCPLSQNLLNLAECMKDTENLSISRHIYVKMGYNTIMRKFYFDYPDSAYFPVKIITEYLQTEDFLIIE